MEFTISWPSREEFAELVSLVRANHAEVTAELSRLGVAMANATDVLNEVAAGLRGPLATSILDLIAERDAAEAARVQAVNALAEEQGREATEEAQESEAAQGLRDAFGEVAGLFEDDDLPDVEPLPEPEPVEPDLPAEPEPTPEPEPAPVTPDEPAPVEPEPEPVPAEEPAVEEPVAPEEPAPVTPDEPAPAPEPVDDGSGAIEPGDTSSDVPASEPGAAPTGNGDDIPEVPNPGADAEQQ